MNKHLVRLVLACLAVVLGSPACAGGPKAAPTASPAPIPSSGPTSLPPTPLAPTSTPAPALAPTDTPIPDLESVLKNNGFERDKTLDSACNTPCSAYKNSSLNVVADDYYTNKSFSLLYYGRDPNGANEQAEANAVAQLLAGLYPGTLSNDVMQVARDFPKNMGTYHGVAGNYFWSVSIAVTYNLDQTIKQATIYIAVTPG